MHRLFPGDKKFLVEKLWELEPELIDKFRKWHSNPDLFITEEGFSKQIDNFLGPVGKIKYLDSDGMIKSRPVKLTRSIKIQEVKENGRTSYHLSY